MTKTKKRYVYKYREKGDASICKFFGEKIRAVLGINTGLPVDIFDTLTKMASSRSIPIYRWSSAGPQQKKVKGRNLFLSEEDARHSCREFQTVTGRGAHTVRVKSSQVTLPPLLPFFPPPPGTGLTLCHIWPVFCNENIIFGIK